MEEEDKRDDSLVPIINEKLETEKSSTMSPKEKNTEIEDRAGRNKSDVSPKGNDSPHQSNNDDSSSNDDSDKGSLGQQGQDESLPGMKGENINGKGDEKDSNLQTNYEITK